MKRNTKLIAAAGGVVLFVSLTPKVKTTLIVYDALGNVVRRLPVPGPSPTDPYVPTGTGTIVWNGRKDDGKGVLPGLYHYRVQTTDQADNTAQSTESAEFLVVLAGSPI